MNKSNRKTVLKLTRLLYLFASVILCILLLFFTVLIANQVTEKSPSGSYQALCTGLYGGVAEEQELSAKLKDQAVSWEGIINAIDVVKDTDEYRVWVDIEARGSGSRDVDFYLPREISSGLWVGQRIKFTGKIAYFGQRFCHVSLTDVMIQPD